MKKTLVLAFAATMSFATFAQSTPTVQLSMGLEHMSLTASQIRKRDRLLKPIYDNYQNVNLASVSNALEKAYGINVFHYMEKPNLSLGNKKGVMESAVRYYMGIPSMFDQADETVVPYRNTVKLQSCDNSYGYRRCTDDQPAIQASLVTGNPKRWEVKKSFQSPSLLGTFAPTEYDHGYILGMFSNTTERNAVYTTTRNPLFSAPVLSDFLEAMKGLNLRGLDATVNFVNGEVPGAQRGYRVIYPHFSRIAPIPQPVIFVSSNASYNDMVEMLQEHAPRIHSYNKLFNSSVLPSVKDINDMLSRYPNVLAEVQKLRSNVDRRNLVIAIQQAFLKVTYGVGAGVVGAAALLTAPVTIFAMAAHPILSPVFIQNIIIFL